MINNIIFILGWSIPLTALLVAKQTWLVKVTVFRLNHRHNVNELANRGEDEQTCICFGS